MTISEKIFFLIFAFTTLSANLVPLDVSIIPRIDTGDMNMNGNPDFIAFNNSGLPRTLYHIEIDESKLEILWEYTMPEDQAGYFVDGVIADFSSDGIMELIISAYREGDENIFYTFTSDFFGIYGDTPHISKLKNTTILLNNPRNMIALKPNRVTGERMFIVTQGSPDPQVLLCSYILP